VRRASRARWGPLLQAGVTIAEYQATMFHCKLLVVDDQLASVGSTNFDNRSFRLNDEANLNVLHAGLARQLTQIFEADLALSKPISLQDWPLLEKVAEHTASLVGAQL
jgi:cardiolipin synthase A/B